MSKTTIIFLSFSFLLIIVCVTLGITIHVKNEKIKALKIEVQKAEKELKAMERVERESREVEKKYRDLKTEEKALDEQTIDDFNNLFDLFLSDSGKI